MALILIAAGAHASIYKWVDAAGTVHYSQTAPQGKDAGEVHVPPAPSKEVTEDAIRRFQELEMEQERRDSERAAEAKSRRDAAMINNAVRMRRCSYARYSLHVLKKQRPVYWVNEKDQEIYLTDKERADRIKKMSDMAQSNCGSQ
jgi:hypothetical protein